jgi:hypothetical protein
MDKEILEIKKHQPILITGAARSGTSLVAGIINICGAFGGHMSGPTNNNRKGMFENARIRNCIIKPYLRDIGVDHLGQYPLPDPNKLIIPENWNSKFEKILLMEGYKEGVWMYKGAKMCLIWPVLHFNFPYAKWVIVRRKSKDIASSCIKTGFMRAFTNKGNQIRIGVNNEFDGWCWWVDQHIKRFDEMKNAGLNINEVWPEKIIINEDYTEIKSIVEWLGLEYKENEIKKFIDPKLWKTRQKIKGVK